MDKQNNFDVVIIGAGISGIDVAYRLQEQCPDRTYTILEAREALGGTWDLMRYPGIRSDSDLYTFGFPFKPWTESKPLAEGHLIVKYMKETAEQFGIDRNIQYRHKVQNANWSTDQQSWSLIVDAAGGKKHFHAKFVVFATGYYNYHETLETKIPGLENFKGKVVHPQFWPKDLDYSGKNVVIIGSGATAITMLPVMAEKTASLTMLQRSPSFVVAVPQSDRTKSSWFNVFLPRWLAFQAVRIQFFIMPYLFFLYCKYFPEKAKKLIAKGAAAQLPKGYPVEPNFAPKYNPWDQRVCFCPDGDFYTAIREEKADVVTATIENITEDTIRLNGSDRVLKPDIIVTATGLKLQFGGGAKVTVDNKAVDFANKHLWKGIMIEDVPNAALVIGYTNASWTLGADATAQFLTRLLNHMKTKNITSAVPGLGGSAPMKDVQVLDLNSTYIVKAQGTLPKAGSRAPWLPRSNYLRDMWESWYGSLTKDMHYTSIST